MTRLYGKIIAVFNKILGAIGLKANKDVIAGEFSPSKSYHAGDIVMRGDVAYRCLVNRDAGAWDDQHFQETDMGLELDRRLLKSEVGPRYEHHTYSYDNDSGLELEINLQENMVSSFLLENLNIRSNGGVSDPSVSVNMPAVRVSDGILPAPSFLCIQTFSEHQVDFNIKFKMGTYDYVFYRGGKWTGDEDKEITIGAEYDQVYLEIRCLGSFVVREQGKPDQIGTAWFFDELNYW